MHLTLTSTWGILGANLEAGELSVGKWVIGMQVILVQYCVRSRHSRLSARLCDSGDGICNMHDGESGESGTCSAADLPSDVRTRDMLSTNETWVHSKPRALLQA